LVGEKELREWQVESKVISDVPSTKERETRSDFELDGAILVGADVRGGDVADGVSVVDVCGRVRKSSKNVVDR